MTGRILQVFGVIVGVVGSILSFVYGGEMISYDFVETGVGILLGGFFGSIIMAALFFAIGSTHIKVCIIEDMLIHERIARKKAAEGIDESRPTQYVHTEDEQPVLQDMVTLYCPKCSKEKTIKKSLYETGAHFYCDNCADGTEYKIKIEN